ncbi:MULTISPECIES: DNA polymerase III subunit theta [unclassified Serratia (in: enterobacteria)]|uniref:DNA polymerase III subunit theta n=1 Tax=unclassified Serratia (in: enterobacteria) TaxID=2647522 RepID=UPI0005013293|nr:MULTISPECIES: DNA polymerase III subunit theta [unclassified Serratia (in: enterobacteria)]KFK94578.1 DNA polymerase III subunit theta [Serratia sp. Ag2]KFK95798.1 DNA polymerase III subunit theta [Serratia sp. Ag1]
MTQSYNLGNLPKEEMDKVNVDLAASGVAYKERLNLPVIPAQVEAEQPKHLQEYFRERLVHYRKVGESLPRGTDPVYQQMAEQNGKK